MAKKKDIYIVEREYLGKYGAGELAERIIACYIKSLDRKAADIRSTQTDRILRSNG